MRGRALLLAAGMCSSCSGGVPNEGPPTAPPFTLRFTVDAPTGSEAYTCFGFDASPLAGDYLRGIAWSPPATGGVALHHASLYALSQDYPDGPVGCDTMPFSSTMHVWAPGDGALVLPEGVGLDLPAGTIRLVVQTHALRFSDGPPATASVSLDRTERAPEHVATWLTALGTVPVIPPHARASTVTTCTAAAPMHVVTAWPHMHRIGTAFQGAILHTDGTHRIRRRRAMGLRSPGDLPCGHRRRGRGGYRERLRVDERERRVRAPGPGDEQRDVRRRAHRVACRGGGVAG
jgi:hypothetical protein